jgi:hypothetical protein
VFYDTFLVFPSLLHAGADGATGRCHKDAGSMQAKQRVAGWMLQRLVVLSSIVSPIPPPPVNLFCWSSDAAMLPLCQRPRWSPLCWGGSTYAWSQVGLSLTHSSSSMTFLWRTNSSVPSMPLECLVSPTVLAMSCWRFVYLCLHCVWLKSKLAAWKEESPFNNNNRLNSKSRALCSYLCSAILIFPKILCILHILLLPTGYML